MALAASMHAFRRSGSDAGVTFFRGAIGWGVALVTITESLSLFEQIGMLSVAISWVLFCVAAFLFGKRGTLVHGVNSGAARGRNVSLASEVSGDALVRAQLVAIAFLALTALALALLAAPATADSMTYHLPRVEHWIQNHSVAAFRSNIERELWPGPGAEYIILHAEVLSRGDRAVTLIQWCAYIANIVVAWILAGELRTTRRGQALAAFLAATIPGAVAQATGAQVELVFSFWLGCAVFFGLRLRALKRDSPWIAASAAFGAAAGLAVFTKATAYVYLAPFAIWFIVASLRANGARALRWWILAGLAALAINAPHYYRNSVLYGNPLSKPGANGVVNSSFSAAGTLSNVVRNISLHFGTPFKTVNAAVEQGIVSIDASLGVAPDDERTTFPGEQFHFLGTQWAEQTAGSPVHVLLALFALAFLIVAGRTVYRTQLDYLLCIAAGFLLFCFYLRWQPWHARLHVPLLMLAAPVSAFVLEKTRRRWIVPATSVLAFVVALPPLLRNPARPLVAAQPVFTIPRQHQYFAEHPALYAPYVAATDHLKSLRCSDVGLWVRGDAAEYPLWTLMRTRGRDGVRIRHISIGNESGELKSTPAGDNFTPCALLYVGSEGRSIPLVVPPGYQITWQIPDMIIYTPLVVPR